MSYIPRYIIKRMIPKDAVKLVGDNIVVEMVNVISPITVEGIPPPEEVSQYLEVKADGEVILDESMPELVKGLKIGWGDKQFEFINLQSAEGETIPVGDKLIVTFPNIKGYAVGETHEYEVNIKSDHPISIKFERELQG